MKVAVTTDTHYCSSTHEENVSFLFSLFNENVDVVVHCGDVSSSNYIEQDRYWNLVRTILGHKIKIITVMGNHDWWDKDYEGDAPLIRPSNGKELFSLIQNIYCKYNIYHASKNLIIDNISISGYDGWYNDKNIPKKYTKDSSKIPHYYYETERWLNDRNTQDFWKSISFLNEEKAKGKTTVLVTHFGFTLECINDWKAKETGMYFGNNPKFNEFIENVDYLFYGHSHQEVDYRFNKTRVINTGSDYYMPKYKIINID